MCTCCKEQNQFATVMSALRVLVGVRQHLVKLVLRTQSSTVGAKNRHLDNARRNK
jgi:hypothetical protein